MPAPEVPDWLDWVWRAWRRLRLDRQWVSGGLGPAVPCRLPWHRIDQWARRHRQDPAFLDACITAMDSEFLAWHAEQQPATKG